MSNVVDKELGGATAWRARQPARRRARRERMGHALMGYLFILPALALYLIFSGSPLIRGVLSAFSDYGSCSYAHLPS
ncbi:MAG: hypothetical protein R2932_29955 [Caldilineaceae bacterium]